MATALVVAIALGFLLGQTSQAVSGSSSPMITQIQELGDLVVLRVNVANVVEDDNTDFKGIWVVRGDSLIAVDMRQAELQSADEDSRRLVVRLPQPRVIQPRVDHDRSRTYNLEKKAWWNPFVDGEESFIDRNMRKAQAEVLTVSSAEDVIAQARDQAESILTSMYRMVGWDVEVVWHSGK